MSRFRIQIAAFGFVLAVAGCASTGLVVDFEPTPAPSEGPHVIMQAVRDVRVFGRYGSLGKAQSTAGDPTDKAWTDRVVGRKLTPTRTLGPDRFLEPTETVAGLVDQALAGGLQRAGFRTKTASADAEHAAAGDPGLRANLQYFWIRQRWNSPQGTLHYQAEVWVQGNVAGLENGWLLAVQGIVSAGAVDMVLWRRAIRTALEKIEGRLAEHLEEARQREVAVSGRSRAD